MSQIFYNGLCLPYPDTQAFEQTAIYDPSGTDWHLTKFDITVQCKINFNYLSLIAPDLVQGGLPSTDKAAEIMSAVRSRLLQPRRAFSFKCGGVELIPQPPAGNAGTVDAKNGPQPQTCILNQLTTTLFLLSWRVVAHYWENNDVSPGDNPVVVNNPGNVALYNRWSETQTIDVRQYSKRIRRGSFVIRSDNTEGMIADEVRHQMAAVGVPRGWLRETSDYRVSEDGLSITYNITDKEIFKYPPRPAYTASGTYTESSSDLGARRWGQVDLQLEGGPGGDHDELVNVAVAVATEKIRNRGAFQNAQGRLTFLEMASIRVGLYDNVVSICMKTLIDQARHRKKGIAGMGWIRRTAAAAGLSSNQPDYPLTNTPLSDNDFATPPIYSLEGSGLLLQAAAYYDPSLRNTLLNGDTGQLSAGLEVGRAGRVREP